MVGGWKAARRMNNADIVGLVCVVLGLFVVTAAVYADPVFLFVSGGAIAAGIVLIITGGEHVPRQGGRRSRTKRPLYAEAVPKVVEVEDADGRGVRATAPHGDGVVS